MTRPHVRHPLRHGGGVVVVPVVGRGAPPPWTAWPRTRSRTSPATQPPAGASARAVGGGRPPHRHGAALWRPLPPSSPTGPPAASRTSSSRSPPSPEGVGPNRAHAVSASGEPRRSGCVPAGGVAGTVAGSRGHPHRTALRTLSRRPGGAGEQPTAEAPGNASGRHPRTVSHRGAAQGRVAAGQRSQRTSHGVRAGRHHASPDGTGVCVVGGGRSPGHGPIARAGPTRRWRNRHRPGVETPGAAREAPGVLAFRHQ